MAKLECQLNGSFEDILYNLETAVLGNSASATREDESDFVTPRVRCAVRVYERYSMLGGNRVSLNITLLQSEDKIYLSAITSGGSQAMLFKINTIGEETFLNCITEVIEKYSI